MALAEIHGKSPVSGSEDFLTADVFTAFRYLPVGIGIVDFLRDVSGLAERIPKTAATATCVYHFWPMGQQERREPDVLLELNLDGRVFHIVVEAKYYSGPSDSETVEVERGEDVVRLGNQLGDQLSDLQAGHYMVFDGYRRSRPLRLASKPENRLLLYLTAHPLRPNAELARAVEFNPWSEGRLFWANWYDVHDHFERLRNVGLPFPFSRVLDDVVMLLDLKRFSTFHGFADLPQVTLDDKGGRFWTDLRVEAATFGGIRPPHFQLAGAQAGFWHGINGRGESDD